MHHRLDIRNRSGDRHWQKLRLPHWASAPSALHRNPQQLAMAASSPLKVVVGTTTAGRNAVM